MRCPYCGSIKDRVTDTRASEDHRSVRRRRECLSCHKRYTTYETIEEKPLYVIKRDGSRQLFDRDKLIQSILKSCAKRPIATQVIEDLVTAIENDALGANKREIGSQEIGEQVLERLRSIDDVAYVRFASVYRDFEDVDSFLAELQRLREEVRS